MKKIVILLFVSISILYSSSDKANMFSIKAKSKLLFNTYVDSAESMNNLLKFKWVISYRNQNDYLYNQDGFLFTTI